MTSTGKILNANKTSNPDLHWALKGGGNNFGVVTRFDLATFPQSQMFGGLRVLSGYLTANISGRVFKAVENFGNSPLDPFAHLIVSCTYEGSLGLTAWTVSPFYTKPEKTPEVYRQIMDIGPAISTTRVSNASDFAKELFAGTPAGKRYLFATLTLKNNATLFAKLLEIYNEGISSVKASRGFQSSFVLQPLSPMIASKGAERGGNPLGLNPDSGALVCKHQQFLPAY